MLFEPTNIECRLTTIDNPFNPFDDFASWFLYDSQKGYDSCSKVARVAKVANSMTEDEEIEAINNAIDEIIAADALDIYKKVYRTSFESTPSPVEDD